MSAYIVNEETMDVIINHLYFTATRNQGRAEYCYRGITELKPDTEEEAQALGDALYQLNLDAVMQRYSVCTIDDLPGPIGWKPGQWKFTHTIPPPAVRAYKAMQCLLYQCSEGDVPEQMLYRRLEETKRDLAEKIVDSLPQYEAAPWG